MSIKVENDRVARISYRISDADGRLMEERTPENHYEYLHGRGQIVGPVERALEGKTSGFHTEVTVSPRDGYGEYDPSPVAELPLDRFPPDLELVAGMKFSTQASSGGSIVVRVIDVDDTTVTVDGNHPLAGLELVFDVKILDVREATEAETESGRPDDVVPKVTIRATTGGSGSVH